MTILAEAPHLAPAESATEQWFSIPASNLQEGDYIRFVAANGRRVEGRVSRQGRNWWCNFETITPALIGHWERTNRPLERRGVPELPEGALRLLRAIDNLSRDDFMYLALAGRTPAGDHFDALCDNAGSSPWWGIWEDTRARVASRARALGPAAMRFSGAASDTLCAAVVAFAVWPKDKDAANPVRVSLLADFLRANDIRPKTE